MQVVWKESKDVVLDKFVQLWYDMHKQDDIFEENLPERWEDDLSAEDKVECLKHFGENLDWLLQQMRPSFSGVDWHTNREHVYWNFNQHMYEQNLKEFPPDDPEALKDLPEKWDDSDLDPTFREKVENILDFVLDNAKVQE